VKAVDSDAGQILTYSLVSGAPNGMKIDSSTGLITCLPTSAGSFNVVVQVADNGTPSKSATTTFTIQIIPKPIQIGPVTVTLSRNNLSAILVSLGTEIDSASASSISNYKLVRVQTRRVGGRTVTTETPVALKSAVYDPKTGLVTLTPTRSFALTGVYHLIIDGSGISDIYKRAIDGDRNGTPGGSARYSLSRTGGKLI
jgi:hypothetical protein